MRPAVRQRLHHLSRNPRVLLRLVIFILGFSFAAALAASTLHDWGRLRDAQRKDSVVPQLEKDFIGEDVTPDSIARKLRRIHFLISGDLFDAFHVGALRFEEEFSLTNLEDLLARSPLDSSQRILFIAYLNARFASDSLREEGRAYIKTHSRMNPPLRFANEFHGDLLLDEDKIEEALSRYEAEAVFPEADYAREKILSLVLFLKDAEKLRSVLAGDGYREMATPRQRIEIELLLENWLGLLRAVVAYDYRAKDNPERVLTLFAASVWFLIVVQFGRFSKDRFVFYILGLLAGIASGTTTLYVVILQENVGGMNSGADWIEEVIYWIVGVALREEVIKLAFFALFTPFLLRRNDALEALLTAACVGLGFALQENVNYYQQNESVAVTRFLTANFFHLAVTGLAGLALYEMLRRPKRHWEEFLATFIGVVLLHGAYNSLISVAELANYSILYLVVFVLLARRFFQKAGELQDARTHVLSPLTVFLVGSTVLIGVVFNYVTWNAPFKSSLVEVGFAVLGVVPVAFVFINHFKDE